METRRRRSRASNALMGAMIVVSAAAGGALLGVVVGGLAISASAQGATEETVTLDVFEVNEYGQTIGDYGIGLTHDPEADPELIRAVGVGGVEGYVYTSEVFGAVGGVLGEVSQRPSRPAERHVSLYAVDGRTVIGTYVADAGY